MAPSTGKWQRGRGQPNHRGYRNDNSDDREDRGAGRGRGPRGNHQIDRPILSGNQTAFMTWRRNIPYSEQGRPLLYDPLTPGMLASFMQSAQHLIEL